MERQAVVRMEEGLHARPAAEVAKLAKSYESALEIVKDGKAASAKSTVKIMLLGVKEGETITIRADGSDEAAALEGLIRLVSAGREAAAVMSAAEPAPAAKPATPAADLLPVAANVARIKGVPGCDGVSIGPVFAYFPETISPIRPKIADTEVAPSIARFRAALNEVCASLEPAQGEAASETQEIVAALLDIARDPEIIADIEARITGRADPVTAVLESGAAFAASFAAMESDYFKTPSVIAAATLSALDFAKLDISRVLGIVICEGGPTSHIAIMARAHGIPAVVGVEQGIEALKTAKILAVNGTEGYAVAEPDEVTARLFAERITREQEAKNALIAFRDIHPHMKNGRAIEVAANIGSLAEVEPAIRNGAMGVGLFRTEFLFMERKTLPTEDEQYAVYSKAAEAFAGRPVVIRTLDVGGDKPIAGIDVPHEENPFLGWRGIRMCLDKPELFKPQLRALLRAAAHGNVKIMFPMISVLEELTAAKALLNECAAELGAEGKAIGKPQIGVMIETPAAVMCAAEIAEEADFFSIGTNDLTQYTMAADRGHPKLASLNRADQPAVLRMIELACKAALAKGKWVGVCGEAAGTPTLIPLLLSFGVSELSMSPALIPRAKKIVTEC
ncbi:MAG: phosphoenolpyruvate--protein phosphotransferase [Aestuariivirgaceae bacterium]|nr:phosphoenolpyruvate--protein phosphotransferase [Aestuariivirgaceae bacterium]